MRYGHHDLHGYMDGGVFGQMPSGGDVLGVATKIGVAQVAALGLSYLEGQQVIEETDKDGKKTGKKILGGEVKLGGKVPLNFVVAGAFAAAGLFDLGESIGVDADYAYFAAAGAMGVWTTNRGHEMGMKARLEKDKDKGSADYVKASLGERRGVPGAAGGKRAWYEGAAR